MASSPPSSSPWGDHIADLESEIGFDHLIFPDTTLADLKEWARNDLEEKNRTSDPKYREDAFTSAQIIRNDRILLIAQSFLFVALDEVLTRYREKARRAILTMDIPEVQLPVRSRKRKREEQQQQRPSSAPPPGLADALDTTHITDPAETPTFTHEGVPESNTRRKARNPPPRTFGVKKWGCYLCDKTYGRKDTVMTHFGNTHQAEGHEWDGSRIRDLRGD